MKPILFSTVAAVCLAPSLLPAAQITDPTTAAVFAGRNLTIGGYATVRGGAIATNGNVFHGGGSLVADSLYGGGNFTVGGAVGQTVGGEVLFNGTIDRIGGVGTTLGSVTSARGGVTIASTATVLGNVTAAGGIGLPSGTVNGKILAGGDVNVGGTVNNGVTYGGAYSTGPFAVVNGPVTKGGAVSPVAYQPLTLPGGSNLAAGTNNVTLNTFETRTLTPGTYGTLSLASGNTVNLTAGTYVFAGIRNDFSLNTLNLDTSGGAIKIYVAGDLNFNLREVLNGQDVVLGTPNAADAAKVRVEVAGSYYGNADVYGTIFAPNGDVTLNTFADVTGRVLAGGDVILLGSNTIAGPEPAALAGLLAAAGLLRRRRR